jgi:hypothetical protein
MCEAHFPSRRRVVAVIKKQAAKLLQRIKLEPIDPALEGSPAYVGSTFYLALRKGSVFTYRKCAPLPGVWGLVTRVNCSIATTILMCLPMWFTRKLSLPGELKLSLQYHLFHGYFAVNFQLQQVYPARVCSI